MDVLLSAEILNVPENNENTWNLFYIKSVAASFVWSDLSGKGVYSRSSSWFLPVSSSRALHYQQSQGENNLQFVNFNLFFYNQNILQWSKPEFGLENQSLQNLKLAREKEEGSSCFVFWSMPGLRSANHTEYSKPETTHSPLSEEDLPTLTCERMNHGSLSALGHSVGFSVLAEKEILLLKDFCDSALRPPRRSTQTELVITVLPHLWYVFVSVCSSGDVKVGASTQGLAPRYKKSPWTAATLAQEAQELTRTVRAILEVDCKWSQLHARRSACPPPPALPVCVCRPAWSRNKPIPSTRRCERLSSPFQCWPSRRPDCRRTKSARRRPDFSSQPWSPPLSPRHLLSSCWRTRHVRSLHESVCTQNSGFIPAF